MVGGAHCFDLHYARCRAMPYLCCSVGPAMADHARVVRRIGRLPDGARMRCPEDWRALIDVASATLTIGSLADAVLEQRSLGDPPAEVRDLLVEVRDRRAATQRITDRPVRPRRLRRSSRSAWNQFTMKGLARLLDRPSGTDRAYCPTSIFWCRPNDWTIASRPCEDLGYAIIVGPEHDGNAASFWGAPGMSGRSTCMVRSNPIILAWAMTRIAAPLRAAGYRPAGRALSAQPDRPTVSRNAPRPAQRSRLLAQGWSMPGTCSMSTAWHAEGIDWPLLASWFAGGTPRRAFKLQMLTASTPAGGRNSARNIATAPGPGCRCCGGACRCGVPASRVVLLPC